MANEIVTTNNNQSPFDGIRQVDADGEYWSARDLMPLLQYLYWQKFKPVIDIAKENIEAAGLKPADHFLAVELKSSGRKALDYRLSRLAAYHVALCCDSRGKESVKLAKHYFAIKTREAEVAEQVLLPRQLPPIRDAIQYLEAAKEIESFADPILRSLLNQRLMEDLGHKTLPGTDRVEQVILTVRAAELGYPQSQIGSGSQLGKFVGRLINPVGKTQHGKYKVNVYECCKELDDCIHAFFR